MPLALQIVPVVAVPGSSQRVGMQLVTYLCFFHQRHLSFADEGLLGDRGFGSILRHLGSRFGKPIGKPVRSYLPEIRL